ncbi:CoA ester lyase [Achromobacter sp. GG226]|uniref:HpcH/HpaI aldolase/citrate lyase family protein n=1 Tax=Verticiella alkaliphila TaxID=2779529 RepID=UPI001C0BD962|nr:CoA ester lyase [Verticiella sp. GG226]MBU4611128.1 CoA ester lyase [Verticiella sp. GG226]
MSMTLPRSLLFVPATGRGFIDKAHLRGADAIVLDLEDAIAPEHKPAARAAITPAVRVLARHGMTVFVRVNAEAQTWAADLASLPSDGVHGVMLPKAETAAQVARFAEALAAHETGAGWRTTLLLAAVIETPLGVLHAAEIAASTPRLSALGFGMEDFSACLGVVPTPDTLRGPAQWVALAARAHGLGCWGLGDTIAAVTELDRLRTAVDQARALGFTGSIAVHPGQLPIINAGFGPSLADKAWAHRVVAAAAEARARGEGVIQVDGQMVDAPILRRAQDWLR